MPRYSGACALARGRGGVGKLLQGDASERAASLCRRAGCGLVGGRASPFAFFNAVTWPEELLAFWRTTHGRWKTVAPCCGQGTVRAVADSM